MKFMKIVARARRPRRGLLVRSRIPGGDGFTPGLDTLGWDLPVGGLAVDIAQELLRKKEDTPSE